MTQPNDMNGSDPSQQTAVSIPTILDAAADWVANDVRMDNGTSAHLGKAIASSESKLTLFRHVLAQSRVRRMARMDPITDVLVQRLQTYLENPGTPPEVILAVGTLLLNVRKEDRVALERTLRDQSVDKTVLDLLAKVLSKEEKVEASKASALDRHSREAVREVVGRILALRRDAAE